MNEQSRTASDQPIQLTSLSVKAPPSRLTTGLWASAGAMASAILSSACCWLPLLLLAFGLSAGGMASFLEAYRPYLLGVTALLLGSGFYLTYFRKKKCGPDGSCAVPNRKL